MNLIIFLTIVCFPSVLFIVISKLTGPVIWQIVLKGTAAVALASIVLLWIILLFGHNIQVS